MEWLPGWVCFLVCFSIVFVSIRVYSPPLCLCFSLWFEFVRILLTESKWRRRKKKRNKKQEKSTHRIRSALHFTSASMHSRFRLSQLQCARCLIHYLSTAIASTNETIYSLSIHKPIIHSMWINVIPMIWFLGDCAMCVRCLLKQKRSQYA